MAKRQLCLWLVLLVEIALAALPLAARAEDAGNPSQIIMRSAFEPGEMPLHLETRVNGRLAGLASFTLRGGELWTTADTLQRLGLMIGEDTAQTDQPAADHDHGVVLAAEVQRLHHGSEEPGVGRDDGDLQEPVDPGGGDLFGNAAVLRRDSERAEPATVGGRLPDLVPQHRRRIARHRHLPEQRDQFRRSADLAHGDRDGGGCLHGDRRIGLKHQLWRGRLHRDQPVRQQPDLSQLSLGDRLPDRPRAFERQHRGRGGDGGHGSERGDGPLPATLRQRGGTGVGHTATPTSTCNGVSGTGTGASQSMPVYATLPSANYPPDTYRDTVTVTVNY
jgi:hypothetical protein